MYTCCMLQYTTAPGPCPKPDRKYPPHSLPDWKHAVWSSATSRSPLREWVNVDVFGLPESIVCLPELVTKMTKAASPREHPMETMDATPCAGSLSTPSAEHVNANERPHTPIRAW
jgi:hypothetical protein